MPVNEVDTAVTGALKIEQNWMFNKYIAVFEFINFFLLSCISRTAEAFVQSWVLARP